MTSTLQSIRQTLADFVQQTAGWEDQVWALVDAGLVDEGLVGAGTEPAEQRVEVDRLTVNRKVAARPFDRRNRTGKPVRGEQRRET